MEAEALLQSPEIGELAAALAAAQGEFEPAAKDREADIKSDKGAYRYKYADLASCLEAIRQPLARNGLAVLQLTELLGPDILLKTTLLHKSGQWIASRFPLPIGEKSWERPQNVGSIITFYRRYTLCALLQIATEDDDGATAMPPPASRRDDERRPRRDDRRERRPTAPPAIPGPAKAIPPPSDGRTMDYEAWLVDYCERVNRHWLDSLAGMDGNAKAPAEIVTRFSLNNHLLKSLGIQRSKAWPINLQAGCDAWKADHGAMIAEAKVYCRSLFSVEREKLTTTPREPGADDMPSPDEEALLDRIAAEKSKAANAQA